MGKNRHLVVVLIAVAIVLFLASSCAAPANNEPAIDSLEAEAEQVAPLDTTELVCTASDPDGDELSYIWSASGGQISGGGASATWTAPASEGSYNVTVKVIDGLGGEAIESVSITVMTNDAPEIVSLTADAEWITPSGNLQLMCSALDPDGDELSYDWSATGGDISGTGASVVWGAPATTGTYDLTVVVADFYGESATKTISVSVLTGEPPVIEALIVTAEHCYLKATAFGYLVGKEQEYHVECVVADTGPELFYEWSRTGGEISETSQDGVIATWTAPDEHIYVTVTVTVSDVAGNTANQGVFLEVVDCSYCTFGC
jgi:hypothetical protein